MNIFSSIRNSFLKVFGDIKVFPYPFFLLYNPGSYMVKGDEMRKVIEVIQEGDILIRGYKNYLDGYFIPGFFSHAGLFLGKVPRGDNEDIVPEVVKGFYRTGEQVVMHSMAEGVFMEDVLNFCRCDYMIILRRKPEVESPEQQQIDFNEVYKRAFRYLGTPYDFKFDFSKFHHLSCTEFVYVCYEDIMPAYQVGITTRKVLGIKKELLTPDDFLTPQFEIVWKSRSIKDKIIQKLIERNLSRLANQ